jgi:hypothetical protein
MGNALDLDHALEILIVLFQTSGKKNGNGAKKDLDLP